MLVHRWWSGILLLGALACTSRVDARLELIADARTPSPTFRIASASSVRGMRVERVEPFSNGWNAPLWQLLSLHGVAVAAPDSLSYGRVPLGFAQGAPAAVLFPGYYRLIIDFADGSGSLDFDVGSDGQVTTGGPHR